MKSISAFTLLLMLVVSACTPALPPATPVASTPSQSIQPALDSTRTPTIEIPALQAITPSPASTQPAGTAKEASQANTDPLTGLMVKNPSLLNRRPLLVKVENMPRNHRPQWGLSKADIVYEYYTEQGMTRFAAVFYGQDADMVAPIRSARFFDVNLIRMYKAVFAFGSAYEAVLNRLKTAEFADRLVIEGGNNCPPMCRYEPNRLNLLYTNTAQLSAYATQKGMDNTRQDLTGMVFDAQAPAGGSSASQIYVRFSASIYNRWDYDAASGRYLRWVDQQDDPDKKKEVYGQLVDRSNNEPIGAENLVILLMPYNYVVHNSVTEVFDMDFTGLGQGYVTRDGKLYPVKWERMDRDQMVQLIGQDGQPFALKPGVTWYEVLHSESTVKQESQDTWRFNFVMPK